MSNYNPYDAAKSIVENKQKWTNAKAKGEDPTQFANDAVAFYEQLRSNGRSDVADYLQKSDAVQAAEYLKKLKGDYKPTVEGTQQKSNEVFETGKAYGQDIKQSFDTVYKNNINVDPTSTEYGKNIRAGYQGAANDAYKSTLAGGADDNNGNVDSFAAANANRQKAAIISQGNDDILKFYDTIAGRANEWAGNKANALSGNLSQLQGNVDSDREMIVQDRNADLVAEQTAADKLKSYYSYLGEAEQAAADIYGAEKDLEGVQYKADKDLEGTKYKANSDYAGVVYKADKSDKPDNTGNLPVKATDVANAIIAKYTTTKYDEMGKDADDNPIYKEVGKTVDWDAANREMSEALSTGKYSGYSERDKQQILDAYNLAGGNATNDIKPKSGITADIIREFDSKKTTNEKILLLKTWINTGVIKDENELEYLAKRAGIPRNMYM